MREPPTNSSATGGSIVDEVAEKLRTAERDGIPIPPVRHDLDTEDVAVAYEVQRRLTMRAVASGRRVIGRKIGLTSRAVQQQLGVDQPDFGVVFADTVYGDGDDMPWGTVMQPRVEAEVAMVLGRDLAERDVSVLDVVRAVDYLLPAIEVVGSRIADWDISIIDTVADNASSGAVVLGTTPVPPTEVDLRSAGMVLELDGRVRSVGSGAACLGHPYRAVLWLARTLAELGDPLRAGDLVLSGALGSMVAVEPGSSVQAQVQGLGAVRFTVGETS